MSMPGFRPFPGKQLIRPSMVISRPFFQVYACAHALPIALPLQWACLSASLSFQPQLLQRLGGRGGIGLVTYEDLLIAAVMMSWSSQLSGCTTGPHYCSGRTKQQT
jgi:hypothetical protein